ncbi:MAG: hypothetical protein WAT71_18150 [Ignavibacteria bacterium]
MVKYIDSVISRLISLKSGMEINQALWNGLPETPDSVQAKIDELLAKEKLMKDAHIEWKVRISESHSLSDKAEKFADKIESLATGLHNEDPEKLEEYDVAQRKKGSSVPKPGKIIYPVLSDDSDGVGFIVSTQKDPDATSYQWFKGVGTDPKNANNVPELQPYKVSSKITFVDDDVEKGVRYFYKVQAFNAHGTGIMSEAVSRIQQ